MTRSALFVLLASLTPVAFAGSAAGEKAVVRVIIDYGDGTSKSFASLPWREGMTVQDALDAAKGGPRGIRYEHTGQGAKAFLTRIDDLGNEGAGEGKRNWQYRVNGQWPKASFGAYKLRPGDDVLWRFALFPPSREH